MRQEPGASASDIDSGLGERLFEIGDDVVGILDAD
jgi:hypothetical protein